MAPKYKLTYFNVSGKAEAIRYIFAFAGQEYEDNRIKREAWSELKPKTNFGKLPIIEVDGKPSVSQSNAIARYLAKQFGLLGANDWEAFQADQLNEAFGDYMSGVMRLFREKDPEKIAEIKKEQSFYLEKFEKILAGNPSGFLVGSKVTWVDLVFAAHFVDAIQRNPDTLKPYPTLAVFVEKINNLPSIKAWLEKRPKSDPPPMRN